MAALNNFQTSDIMDADSSVAKVTQGAPPLPSSAPPPPPPLSSPPHSPPLKLQGGGDRLRKEVTLHARNGSVEQTGNTLADNAKSSFLKSTLSHTTSAATEGNSTNKTQPNNKSSSSSLF